MFSSKCYSIFKDAQQAVKRILLQKDFKQNVKVSVKC
jgi:hypothetical protein